MRLLTTLLLMTAAAAQTPDYANLTRYRAENAALPPTTDGRVVFLGDSLTDNWGHNTGSFFPGKPFLNRGIGGQTTDQILLRFQPDVAALHPAAMVLLAGTNDIAAGIPLPVIEDNFRSLVTLARAAHIRVILASTLPAGSIPWRPAIHPTEPIRELNRWLQAYARETHSTWLDYTPALALPDGSMRPELASDRAVHPNAAGYILMQPLAEAAIAHSLAQPRP